MYYSVPPWGDGRPHDGWVVGVAESRDLDNWTKICDLPRLTALEENGFCAPGAIVLDGTVHLFYQTYGNGANDAICHAVSRDGIRLRRMRRIRSFIRPATGPAAAPSMRM